MSHGFFVCSKQIIDLKLETQIAGVNQLSRFVSSKISVEEKRRKKSHEYEELFYVF